jgi:hypothetical protein
MQTRFFASQSVLIDVPNEPVPIQHYLRQPHRLVHALTDPSRIEQLDCDSFRLKMRPLKFIMLSVQPTVDIQIRAYSNGAVYLKSIACEIRGIEYINQRFDLKLAGKLYPCQRQGQTQLEGKADLEVRVELPPPLWLTPKPILERTGNSLLKGVMSTIKQRLMHQLLVDYHEWATSTVESSKTDLSQGLLTETSSSASVQP